VTEPRASACADLRAKRAYGDLSSSAEPDWEDGLLATDCFWCLKTLQAWGPDGRPAVAGECAAGRVCHTPRGSSEDGPRWA
jgi:hypothetical protein